MKLQYLSVRIYLPYTAVCTAKYRFLKFSYRISWKWLKITIFIGYRVKKFKLTNYNGFNCLKHIHPKTVTRSLHWDQLQPSVLLVFQWYITQQYLINTHFYSFLGMQTESRWDWKNIFFFLKSPFPGFFNGMTWPYSVNTHFCSFLGWGRMWVGQAKIFCF